MSMLKIETPRLILRSWREEDIGPFHEICSDPEVMATLGPVMTIPEVAALIGRMQQSEAEHGHCCWAMVQREDARLIGWCGVVVCPVGPIAGKREIGWRMARDCWGQGLVTEAARASVDWLFANCADESLWAITSTGNRRSRAVMDRLGMTCRPDLDFNHPRIPAESPLLRHVTYELPRVNWNRS